MHMNTWTVVSCMMRTCSPSKEWATAALWHSGQVRAMYRESQLDEQSLSLLLREKRREKRAERENEKSTKEENEGRERRKREGTRKREENPPPPPFLSLLTVCRFKTSPCVGSKRFRVCRQNARMCAAHHRASGGARRRYDVILVPAL